MNVGIISDYAAVYSGNFISSILSIADSIKEKNNVIFCFPCEAESREWIQFIKDKGYKVFFFSRKKINFIFGIRRICRKNHVNFAYFHFVSPALGKTTLLFKKTKACFHIHSDFSGGKPLRRLQKIKDTFFDKIVKRKSIYIFVSKDLYDKSFARIKYHIPNGLFKKTLPVIDKEDVFLSEADSRYPVFLSFAWSPFVKGIDILCKAFKSYLETNKGILMLVYGKNGGEKNLKDFLNKQGINDFKNIVFLPPIEDVATYYKKASCFISSSRSEGFSYSVLEAISYNKSVIVSDISGTSWSMKFRGVISFKSEDSVSLKKAMTEASRHSLDKIEIAENTSLLKEYSGERWSSLVLNVLRENEMIL